MGVFSLVVVLARRRFNTNGRHKFHQLPNIHPRIVSLPASEGPDRNMIYLEGLIPDSV